MFKKGFFSTPITPKALQKLIGNPLKNIEEMKIKERVIIEMFQARGFRGTKTNPAITKIVPRDKPHLFGWFDHVHSPDDVCLRNTFGPKCVKPVKEKGG